MNRKNDGDVQIQRKVTGKRNGIEYQQIDERFTKKKKKKKK